MSRLIDADGIAWNDLKDNHGREYKAPLTYADLIRAMSDEELAKFLWKTGRNYRAIRANPVADFREHYGDLMDWLQQPAEED